MLGILSCASDMKNSSPRSRTSSKRPRPTGSTDPGFSVGDRVTWVSQAGGRWKTKRGTIVEVVPAGRPPKEHQTTAIRDHVSYVVEARDVVNPKGRVETYWPVASKLKHVRKAKVTHVAIVPEGQAPEGCVVSVIDPNLIHAAETPLGSDAVREEETGSRRLSSLAAAVAPPTDREVAEAKLALQQADALTSNHLADQAPSSITYPGDSVVS